MNIKPHDRPGTKPSPQSESKPKQPFNLDAMRWAASVSGIGSSARSVLLVLAQYSDIHGVMWHSAASIAEHAQCSTRSVHTHTKKLEELGMIRIVGRLTKGRGQVSNAYVLKGWPTRTWMPVSGHPKLGPSVTEDKYDRLFRSWNEKNLPRGVESSADEKLTLNHFSDSTSYEECMMQVVCIMDQCFDALGTWATPENHRHLSTHLDSFLDLLGAGFSLQFIILPVLREKAASEQEIPILKSWAYFREAMQRRADALEKVKAREEAWHVNPRHDALPPHTQKTAKDGHVSDRTDTAFAQDISRMLKSVSKGLEAKPNWGDD